MSQKIIEILKQMIALPDLASKKWVYQQYDSHVMNDTIATNGDAAIIRVHGTNKALALTSDCTPRYVESDPEIGAMQAVCETYRNISATGATPLAITNCLNFGNPEKPKIMGQIVKSIKGINKACEFLSYPVVSGNVSLYNETNGNAINPTPTIAGVGLLKNLKKRADSKFTDINDEIFVIGKLKGHLDCSIYQRDILKIANSNNPPSIDLVQEKNNSEFIRNLVADDILTICHDISDGGLLVSLFEMSSNKIGCEVDIDNLSKNLAINQENLCFGEDQSCYVVAINLDKIELFKAKAKQKNIEIQRIGKTIPNYISISDSKISIEELKELNSELFENAFAY